MSFRKFAAVMNPQAASIAERGENNDTAAAADLTAKVAVFVFRALAVVRDVGCDDELGGDELDDDRKSLVESSGL